MHLILYKTTPTDHKNSMPFLPRRAARLVLALTAITTLLTAAPSVVRVVNDGQGHFTLTRDGRPYEVRGVGGDKQLETVRALGATTIRTWGIEQLDQKIDGKNLLDRCHELGLTVMAGIWIQHERHGFKYSDPA